MIDQHFVRANKHALRPMIGTLRISPLTRLNKCTLAEKCGIGLVSSQEQTHALTFNESALLPVLCTSDYTVNPANVSCTKESINFLSYLGVRYQKFRFGGSI